MGMIIKRASLQIRKGKAFGPCGLSLWRVVLMRANLTICNSCFRTGLLGRSGAAITFLRGEIYLGCLSPSWRIK
jgi:hypothetical protein